MQNLLIKGTGGRQIFEGLVDGCTTGGAAVVLEVDICRYTFKFMGSIVIRDNATSSRSADTTAWLRFSSSFFCIRLHCRNALS